MLQSPDDTPSTAEGMAASAAASDMVKVAEGAERLVVEVTTAVETTVVDAPRAPVALPSSTEAAVPEMAVGKAAVAGGTVALGAQTS